MILAVALIFVVITVVGIIGNLLVLFVIGVNRQLHDSTNLLICNLALADLLFLVFCVPITAYGYVYSWHFSGTVCYVTVTLQYVTCYVSVWTLVLLAYDRYISIVHQKVSRRMRRSNGVLWVCAAVWLSVFGLNFLQMRDVGVLSFQYNETGTMLACVDSVSIATETSSVLHARIFYWSFNLGAYVLPLALSTLFYVLLVRAIWREKIVSSKSSEKMKRHATKMVFVVIFTFGVCWFPQNTRFFLRGFNYPNMMFWERDADLLLIVQSTFQVIAYANSCLNPILYGALSERFRLGLSRAWHRFVCCGPRSARYRNTGALFNSPAFGDSFGQGRGGKFANDALSRNPFVQRASSRFSRDVFALLSSKRRANSSAAQLTGGYQTDADYMLVKSTILRSSTANSLATSTRLHERLRSLLSLKQDRTVVRVADESSTSALATCVRDTIGSESTRNSTSTSSGIEDALSAPPPRKNTCVKNCVLPSQAAAGILLLYQTNGAMPETVPVTRQLINDTTVRGAGSPPPDYYASAAAKLVPQHVTSLAGDTEGSSVVLDDPYFDFDDGDVIHL